MNLASAPPSYLGESDDATYPPVCVAWTSPKADGGRWTSNCGALWHSAESMGLAVVGAHQEPGVDASLANLELVPIEALMWILEPARLGVAVDGRDMGSLKENGPGGFRKGLSGAMKHQLQLAQYLEAEIGLLTGEKSPERSERLPFRGSHEA